MERSRRMKRERRRLTPAELARITSRRPVVRRIERPPKKEENRLEEGLGDALRSRGFINLSHKGANGT